jgi:hypothetical protein
VACSFYFSFLLYSVLQQLITLLIQYMQMDSAPTDAAAAYHGYRRPHDNAHYLAIGPNIPLSLA